jgi:hypothetical protein
MNRRLAALIATLAALSACAKGVYVADGPLARPLTQFERIDVRAMANKVPAGQEPSETPPSSADKFLHSFRLDLTNRLHRKRVLHLASGSMLILQASLIKYECVSRSQSNDRDILAYQGTIEVEVVLTDESGKRIGGGKASNSEMGSTAEDAMKEAQKKIVAGIGDYIKKSARGSARDVPDPDEPP